MNLDNYKKILIWGYGVSGKSVERVLIDKNVNYNIYYKNCKINNSIFLKKLSKKKMLEFDLIVISPGVSIFEKYLQFAISNNIEVISELEFGFNLIDKKSKIIAVTGTNGKTTTCDLLFNMLKNSGLNTTCVGNIGLPISSIYKEYYDYLVVEVSSFQLEAIKDFKADFSIILNIAQDHLDRHKTFDNYINCKLNLLKNIKSDDYFILNFDDKRIKERASRVNANKISVSIKNKNANYYLNQNGYICENINNKNKCIFKLLPSITNSVFLTDFLCVIAVAKQINISNKIIRETIANYNFKDCRCENVATIKGVDFINDSKATNIHSALASVNSFKGKNICLLLGGFDKKLDFKYLFKNLPNNVLKLIFFGDVRYKLKKCAREFSCKNYIVKHKFREACECAFQNIDKVDVVLLSPACSSFDEFNSYLERGNFFKEYVLKLKELYEKEDMAKILKLGKNSPQIVSIKNK